MLTIRGEFNYVPFFQLKIKVTLFPAKLMVSEVCVSFFIRDHFCFQFKGSLTDGKGGQLMFNSMVFYEDYSLSVYNHLGAKQFTREEGLAYISNVEMLDFPLMLNQEELGGAQQSNVLTMFIKRIRTQLVQLKEFVTITLSQKLTSYLNSNQVKRSPSSTGSATRDEFNLNKLIVASTSIGKVFGLQTNMNGNIMWSFYLKNTKPFKWNKLRNELTMPLYLQRTAAHYPYEPQCALIAKQETDDGGVKSLVYYFNPLTGQPSKDLPQNRITLDYEIKQAFLSNVADEKFLKSLIVLDGQTNVLHILPETSTHEFGSGKPSVLYLASDDEIGSSLIGYAMSLNGKVKLNRRLKIL